MRHFHILMLALVFLIAQTTGAIAQTNPNQNEDAFFNEAPQSDEDKTESNLPKEDFSDLESNSNFQAPMQNVFLNTLFGGTVGFFLGISYAVAVENAGSEGKSFGDSSSTVIRGTLNGAIVGVLVGTMLSFSNIKLSDDAGRTSIWQIMFSENDTHSDIAGEKNKSVSIAFSTSF